MSKGFASNYRIVLLAGFVVASFAGLTARLVWLQVYHRDELLQYVEKAHRRIIVQTARRGDILDAHDNLLATSRPLIELGVDPQSEMPEDEKKWPQLAALIGRPLPEVVKILTTRFRSTAAPVRPPEGVGMAAGASAAASGSLVFNLTVPGITSSASPPLTPVSPPLNATSPPPAAEAAAADDDDTQTDDPDAQGNRPIKWAKLSDSVTESVYADILKLDVGGVYGQRVYRRDYPDNGLAAHVIGYANHKEVPVTGIEAFADFYLRGQDGWLESEKDSRRRELAQFRSREVPASDGYSVKLSIDATVQHIVEAELDSLARKYQPQKATIIVSDPRTGFILALANYPSFNLNQYNQVPKDEQRTLRNVAVTDQYEPGSVFKIVAVSAAIDSGLVTPSTTFDCTLSKVPYDGTVFIGGKPVKAVRMLSLPHEMASDHFGHSMTVAQIIGRSSNKGAAQLGMALGEQRFYDFVHAFGFGQRTGFPVAGEKETSGDLPPLNKWDELTITRMPMGQSVAVTALQIHQAMGVIASGGVLLRPQVITQVLDPSGGLVYSFRRSEVRRVISPTTARTMTEMLERVATKKVGDQDGGTGSKAAIAGYDVAGKTGTANKLEPVLLASGKTQLRYSEKHHVASFVGFFPAGDPQVAISVIVDDADAHAPPNQYTGGDVAAPSFKTIGEQLIPYLDIRPASAPPLRAASASPLRAALAMEGSPR
jgi:cell division protein FtsI (penicillin-binding protein 3)